MFLHRLLKLGFDAFYCDAKLIIKKYDKLFPDLKATIQYGYGGDLLRDINLKAYSCDPGYKPIQITLVGPKKVPSKIGVSLKPQRIEMPLPKGQVNVDMVAKTFSRTVDGRVQPRRLESSPPSVNMLESYLNLLDFSGLDSPNGFHDSPEF